MCRATCRPTKRPGRRRKLEAALLSRAVRILTREKPGGLAPVPSVWHEVCHLPPMNRGRTIRTGLAGLAGLLLLAQAFRIDRTNPPVESDVPASPGVKALLRRACYDCHSNETVWPWYSRLAPASWLLANDLRKGRAELNFSTWGAYGAAKKMKQLKETAEEVAEGQMPPWYYRLIHRNTRLTPAEIAAVREWVTEPAALAGP
jgi:hypothetical protein